MAEMEAVAGLGLKSPIQMAIKSQKFLENGR
jgi:hypothetical protein